MRISHNLARKKDILTPAKVAKKQRDLDMAKFKKGDKKPANSGRKKGTPNKVTKLVAQRLQELDCDPVDALVKLLHQQIPPEEKLADLKIIQIMMQYSYFLPKHPADIGGDKGLQPPTDGARLLDDEEIEKALR